MPQIFAAVAAVFTAISSFTVAGIAVGKILLLVGLSLIQSALTPKPKQGWRGDTQQVSLDPNDPRRILVGRTATAGALMTFQSWGNNNEYMIICFRLADHKTNGLVGAWWNGNRITIGGGGAVSQAFADGHDNLWITYHNGDWNQAASADLIANSGGRWTSSDRARGITYVEVKARYNEKAHPQGLSGLFQFVFKIDGAYFYDRRLDTSVGGSGSQRFNDQTTWTLNGNATVAGENLLRGIRVEDTSVGVGSRTMDIFYGLTFGDSDLPFSENIAAMNSCDQAVSLLTGGTEPRYRVSGLITCDQPVETPLNDILGAMAGSLLTSPGRWIFKPGVAQTAVRSFVDGDRRLDGPYKFTNDISFESINNAVYGKFSDPSAMYQAGDLPPRLSPADEATDHGHKQASLSLNLVTSQTQGQRVMEIFRRRGRAACSAQLAWPPENLDLEAQDWVTWQSDRYGWTKTFAIAQGAMRTGNDDMLMTVFDIGETNSSIFGWTPASDELSRTNPHALPSAAPSAVSVTTLTAAVGTITNAAGAVVPVLTVTCDALADPTIHSIRFEYRVNGLPAGAAQTHTKDFAINPATQVGTQTFVLADGVIGGFQYQVRAAAVVVPPQDLNWTGWVTTGSPSAAIVSDNIVNQGNLAVLNDVATANIQNNAVSSAVVAYTGSAIAVVDDGADHSIQSATLTTHTGAFVVIHVAAYLISNTLAGGQNITAKVKRDGSVIYTLASTTVGSFPRFLAIPYAKSPSAGSHTYTVEISISGGAGTHNATFQDRFLYVEEFLR